jgi:hypothetical protein
MLSSVLPLSSPQPRELVSHTGTSFPVWAADILSAGVVYRRNESEAGLYKYTTYEQFPLKYGDHDLGEGDTPWVA